MTPLIVESWIWWATVIFVAGSRFISRRMALGSFKRYQSDDYGMMVVLCFYTTVIATINIVNDKGSNLFPAGFDIGTLSDHERNDRIFGSKLVLVVEQSQCVTIWGAKICLLILYLRLTTLRWQNIGIRILLGYVVGSFVVMDILYFGVWCRPFYEYWAIPTNSSQCNAATNHLITNAVFNLTSDAILLAIGLPMFMTMKLQWQKKLPLVLIFSLGVFVILAAVLNKIHSFFQPFGSMWSFWYIRESSTALLVANLPFVWQIWRKIVRFDTIAGATRRMTTDRGSGEVNPSIERDNNRRNNGALNFARLARWPSDEHDHPEESAEKDHCRHGSWKQHDTRQTRGDPFSLGLSPWKSEGDMPTSPQEKAVTKKSSKYGGLRRVSDDPRPYSVSGSFAPASLDQSNSANSFV
ncbi:related to integral membrane PTH11 [Lecanosticta acicola]|uniref:Related to integral membrane PTH11 n=1 Tax=Lecanosticta acicola TaxID=111012 RepID=A0AAI8Z916_9PEZI|nr:related to integral membrane PTH11 [Lecanosticta acicola]